MTATVERDEWQAVRVGRTAYDIGRAVRNDPNMPEEYTELSYHHYKSEAEAKQAAAQRNREEREAAEAAKWADINKRLERMEWHLAAQRVERKRFIRELEEQYDNKTANV